MKKSPIALTCAVASLSALLLASALGCSPAAGPANEGSGSSAAPEAPAAAAPAETSSEAAPQTTSPAAANPNEASEPVAPTAPAAQEAANAAIEQGYQVFSGVVHVCTPKELIELQGVDIDPAAASHDGTYAVLVFDVPTEVTGMSADGSGERTEIADMLGIAELTEYETFTVEYGDLEAYKALDGQEVLIAALADDIMFPSDVRLPIGQPAASAIEVLS